MVAIGRAKKIAIQSCTNNYYFLFLTSIIHQVPIFVQVVRVLSEYKLIREVPLYSMIEQPLKD